MHEKVEHLFAQKTKRQNKLPFPLLSLLLQILFNVRYSLHLFSCSFSFNITFTTFSNNYLRAKIFHKISETFISEIFELSRSFGGGGLKCCDSFISYYIVLR